jgi:hypothetical protein
MSDMLQLVDDLQVLLRGTRQAEAYRTLFSCGTVEIVANFL